MAKPSDEEVKRLASIEVQKVLDEEATKKAVAAEVKRQLAAKYEATRAAQEGEAAKDKAKLIKGIQVKHGATMRSVAAKYSVDSKPMFVDKG